MFVWKATFWYARSIVLLYDCKGMKKHRNKLICFHRKQYAALVRLSVNNHSGIQSHGHTGKPSFKQSLDNQPSQDTQTKQSLAIIKMLQDCFHVRCHAHHQKCKHAYSQLTRQMTLQQFCCSSSCGICVNTPVPGDAALYRILESRGGARQSVSHLRDSARGDSRPAGVASAPRSRLAEALLFLLGWGIVSSANCSWIARCAWDDGLRHDDLKRLASAGSWGRSPQSSRRDS